MILNHTALNITYHRVLFDLLNIIWAKPILYPTIDRELVFLSFLLKCGKKCLKLAQKSIVEAVLIYLRIIYEVHVPPMVFESG